MFILVSALSIPASFLPLSPSPCKMRRQSNQVKGWEENHVFQGKRLHTSSTLFSSFPFKNFPFSQPKAETKKKHAKILFAPLYNLGFFLVHSEWITLAWAAMIKQSVLCYRHTDVYIAISRNCQLLQFPLWVWDGKSASEHNWWINLKVGISTVPHV